MFGASGFRVLVSLYSSRLDVGALTIRMGFGGRVQYGYTSLCSNVIGFPACRI